MLKLYNKEESFNNISKEQVKFIKLPNSGCLISRVALLAGTSFESPLLDKIMLSFYIMKRYIGKTGNTREYFRIDLTWWNVQCTMRDWLIRVRVCKRVATVLYVCKTYGIYWMSQKLHVKLKGKIDRSDKRVSLFSRCCDLLFLEKHPLSCIYSWMM